MSRLSVACVTGLVMFTLACQPAGLAGERRLHGERHDWRRERHPRIDLAPDPSRIRVLRSMNCFTRRRSVAYSCLHARRLSGFAS
jgi:hypothetical protein